MGPNVPSGSLIVGPGAPPADEIAPKPGRTRELVEVILVAVVLALFVRTFLVQAFVVPTGSMEQTLLVGDHVLVNKFIFAPRGALLSRLLPFRDVRAGDVIVFKFPKDPTHDYVKRAVALPGDTLEIRNRVVYVNATAEATRAPGPRPRGSGDESRFGDHLGPLRIPAGSYFAMGDNRDSSNDSRFWGPVPAENLKGRALLVYWSFDAAAVQGSVNPIRWIAGLARHTRWSRTFLPVR